MSVVSEPDGFDAFISYSHAADGQLTPAVRLGMQAVGKKWYRRRASRIFCDQSSLSATPELWPTIEQALSASRFLVLLASPQAAASVWVRQELDWWRSHRSPSTVLIGLTDGELVWDESRPRFDPARTTALPPSALNWFAREPLWVDLRWAREARHLSLRDPRFRDCMAGLVAPVRGVPKDALIGEDIRQHRRSMRLVKGGVTLLAIFAVVSLVAALLAVQRGNTALARQVAAAAVSNTTQRLDLAMLLAAEAYREEPTAQSTAALFQAVTASPHLVRFADNGTPVTALASARDGTTVVTGGADGTVRAWELTGDRAPTVIADLHQPVTSVAVSDDARSVAVGGASGLVMLAHSDASPPTVLRQSGPPVRAAAVAGARVAVIDDKPELNLFESGTDRVVAASVSSGVAAPFGSPSIVSFGADGRELLLGTPLGETSRWSATSLRRLGDWTSPQTPFNGFTPGYSGDGAWFGYLKFGITVASTAEGSSSVRNYPLQTRSDASALAISPDASRVAVASEGTISVVQEEIPYRESGPPGQYGGLVTDPLSGVGTTVTGLAFVGGSQLLVSASQRTLALWDLRQQSRIAAPTGVDLPDQTEGSFTPELAVSPTGRLHAWVNDSGELIVAQAADGGGPPTLRQAVDAGAPAVIFFAPDEHQIYSVASAAVEAWTLDGGALRKVASWPFPVDTYLSFAAATADAAAVYAMESDGRIHRISTVDGTVTTLPTGITGMSSATVALRPDGAELVVRDERDGTRLVDLHTGVTRPGPDFDGPVASVDYSPDGRYLAASDGQAIVSIWDVSTGRELRRIPAERVDRIFFNPAGSRLATITDDGRIALWDVADGARLGEVRVRQLDETTARDVGWQTQLIWEPSGTALWTATVGGTVLRWDLDPGQWVHSACAAAGRSLTADEWQQVIGSSPPGDLRCGQ